MIESIEDGSAYICATAVCSMRRSCVFISPVFLEDAVSGKRSFGTAPYFLYTFMAIVHWPPSPITSASRCCTRRESDGSPASTKAAMSFRK